MNNLKKIGLTALAGSLVATSAFAGELTATGSASMGVKTLLVLQMQVLVKTFQWVISIPYWWWRIRQWYDCIMYLLN